MEYVILTGLAADFAILAVYFYLRMAARRRGSKRMKDDEITTRKTPPDTPEEWAFLWRGAHRANDGWVIVGPIVAIALNWKAWAIALVFFLWINRPDILAALTTIMGGKP